MAKMQHITVQQLKQGRVPRFHWHSLYPNIYPTMPLDFDNTLSYIEQIGLLYAKMNELLRIVAKMLEEFYDYADDLFEAIVNIYNQIVDMYNEILEIYEDIKNIHGDINNIYGDINNIYTDIKNIYEDIQNIYNSWLDISMSNYKILTPGTDYDTTFFNRWTSPNGQVQVGIIDSFDRVTIQFSSPNNADTFRLSNPDVIENVSLRHTTPIADARASILYLITFKGEYAYLNTSNFQQQNESSGIWNLSPSSTRASWQAITNITRLTDSYTGYLLNVVSYADGYNTQFNVYDVLTLPCVSANLVKNFTVLK